MTGSCCQAHNAIEPPLLTPSSAVGAPGALLPAGGQPIGSERERKAIYEVVKAHLMGTSTLQQQQQQLAAVAGAPLLPAHQLGGVQHTFYGGPEAATTATQVADTSILRNLSAKWRFG